MRILFINHTGKVSGAERVLLSIMERLDGFTVRLLCPPGDLYESAERMGVSCRPLEELSARFTSRPDKLVGYLGSFRNVAKQIRAEVSEWRPDFIHANTVRAGIAATLATMGMRVRVVWHVHDILPHHPLSTAIRSMFVMSPRCHAVCVSNATARRFRGLLLSSEENRRRIHVLHNGIEPATYSPMPGGHSPVSFQLRKEVGLSPEAFVTAIVGQLTPRKGQLGLIEAFPALLSLVPNAVLLVVGTPLFNRDSEYSARMEEAIRENHLEQKVFLLGHRRDVPAILCAADALIMNSSEEPFGMVLLEAMACAKAVVSANVGGVPEIIHDRRNGLLYEHGDYAQLMRHLKELADDSDLRTKLGMHARETVTSRFTIAIQVPQLIAIYRRMMGDRVPGLSVSAAAAGEEV